MQKIAGAGHPAPDRADRPTEPAGGLVVRESFEVAEDHRRAERARQASKLLVEDRRQLALSGNLSRRMPHRFEVARHRPFVNVAPGRAGTRPDRHAMRDPVQPTPDQSTVSD